MRPRTSLLLVSLGVAWSLIVVSGSWWTAQSHEAARAIRAELTLPKASSTPTASMPTASASPHVTAEPERTPSESPTPSRAASPTPAAAALDAVLRELGPIRFDGGSVAVTRDARDSLAKLVPVVQPGVSVRLVGHTDNGQNDRARQRLALARAEAVRDLLIEYGLSPDQVTAESRSDFEPVASNDSREGRALNRRVEIIRGEP